MRQIKYIVVHCTAGSPNQSTESIKAYWKNHLKWKQVGYHYLISADGTIEQLATDDIVTNGVANYNSVSVHVSYKGGVDSNGKAKDTRTDAQKGAILKVLKEWRAKYPNAIIQGHRDFPGVKKDCPSFNAKAEYAHI